jgi:hypothetical protein
LRSNVLIPVRESEGELSLFRRVVERIRGQDWFAVGIELVVVVVGIVIGLQATDWSNARRDRADLQDYLQRLLGDTEANLAELHRVVAREEQRAAKIRSIGEALGDATKEPDPDALSSALCRWYVEPDVHLQHSTYQEMLSSGRLLLIQNQLLREQFAAEDATHAETRRLDLLISSVQHGAEPIDGYRTWHIDDSEQHRGTTCTFDTAGMRRDPRIASALAQLYRGQDLYVRFHNREIESVEKTHTLLLEALGRPPATAAK